MNLNLVYKTAYKYGEPFEKEHRSKSDFSMGILIAGIVDELSEKKEEISFIGLFLCYLNNVGLDLNDLEYSLEQLRKREELGKYEWDKIIYSNFSENKLFENINKAKKAMPSFFKDMLPSEVKNLNEEYISYSKLLLGLSDEKFFIEVLSTNLKGKSLEYGTKGKVFLKFVESFLKLPDIQNDYVNLVGQIAKETKLKPAKVYDIMQKMLEGCTSFKVQVAQELYKKTPKYKTINKRTLSNGVEIKGDALENEDWRKISDLGKYVIGQDEAVSSVAEKIMGSYVGFQSEKEPVATFLLTGPTGVGKTETAKAVANLCFDKNIFVVDMTTFKSDADISRLLGGSPNYVGYGDPNAFCDFVAEHPKCVLLFDEIDKASKGCLDLLMRMIDEGEFINAKGNVVSLRDAVIMCTTNLTEYVQDKTSNVEEKITNTDGLRKEMVGRFSEVIEYKQLTKEACREIAERFFLASNIGNFERRNQNKFLKLVYSQELLDKIIDDANYSLFGARDLKKSIQKNFITPVSKYILKYNPENQTLHVGIDGVKNVENSSQKTPTMSKEGIGRE